MNKFDTILAQRRAQREYLASPCYIEMTGAISLQVEASNGTAWVLPWNEFVAAKFFRDGLTEKLCLSFRGHEVIIHGFDLQCLCPIIAAKKLAALCPVKKDFIPVPGQMIAKSVEVREIKK
jgi:hypothetical protein